MCFLEMPSTRRMPSTNETHDAWRMAHLFHDVLNVRTLFICASHSITCMHACIYSVILILRLRRLRLAYLVSVAEAGRCIEIS